MTATVTLDELRPGVSRILLNKPDRLNAIDDNLISGLHQAIDKIEADGACRAVILTGAGKGFCAGFDLKGGAGAYEGDPSTRSVVGLVVGQKRLSGLVIRLREMPQPVIAAVNGPAAGGGLALALAADVRVASDSAIFVVANIKVGVSGGEMGISYLLPRLVGLGRATELMLTGRRMDAAEALQAGLVVGVVPPEEVLDAALAIADQIVGNSPFAIWMTKELIGANADAPGLRHAIQLEDRTQVLANYSGDLAEAVRAFREKRAPRFTAE